MNRSTFEKSKKMKIQYCSDLHLEFPENRVYLKQHPVVPSADVLVLAGDIVTFPAIGKARDFFDLVCDQFESIYWLPGNHEYYGADLSDKPNPLYEKVRGNLFLVNNYSLHQGGVGLVFSTLWSRISPHLEWDIQRSISDFEAIAHRGHKLTPGLFTGLHAASLSFLRNALQPNENEPVLVVTHHVPTLMNYPSIYKNSPLNEAFAVELFDLIMDHNIDTWIYGHHHVNTPEFLIGNTRMITNQLGYVRDKEYGSFRTSATIELVPSLHRLNQ